MRCLGRVLGSLAALAPWGCGDDGVIQPGAGSGGDPPTTTLPLPTATGTDDPGSTTAEMETSADETGLPPPDVPSPVEGDCEQLGSLVEALPGADAAAQQAMIEGFVHAVGYGEHGFPGVEGSTLCAVYRGESGQDLSLAGDLNAWVPGEHALLEPVAGLGFYYVIVALPDEPSGLYKLVRDDVEFFADPLARRFGWDEFGEYSQVDARPDRSHHERWLGFDDAAGTLAPRTVTVYLPIGAQAEADLPVLYMHDGQNLFSPDAFFGGWRVSETLDLAIADGTLAPMVVVGIDNTVDRFDEYTPVPDVLDGLRVGGRADEYVELVVGGIKPFVEARYPVATAPAAVATMGSSLGGLISLYLGLRHPDVFGHVASMSGTIDWGTLGAANPTIDGLYADDPPVGLRIYLDSGGSEGGGCPGGGTDNYCGNVRFAGRLRTLGWVDEVDLVYRWEPGALHNEAAWADRLLGALVDWFPSP